MKKEKMPAEMAAKALRIKKAVREAVIEVMAELEAEKAKKTDQKQKKPVAAEKPAKTSTAKTKKPAKKAAKKPSKAKANQSAMMTDSQIEREAKKAPKRLPEGVFYSADELTCFVGSYPVKALAEREAKEFLNTPDVLLRRSAVFPDYRRFGILPSVTQAKIVKRDDRENPWGLLVSVDMVGGKPENRAAWASGVLQRCRSKGVL